MPGLFPPAFNLVRCRFSHVFSHGKSHFLKLVISEYKHNINNHPFEVLIAREDCPSQFCLVQPLLDYLALRGNRPGLLFCNCSLALPINLSLGCTVAFLSVALTPAGIKVTVFASVQHDMWPTKVSLMHKSALLVARTLIPLKLISVYISGRKLPPICKLSFFRIWVSQ